MPTYYTMYNIQLMSLDTQETIITAGGRVVVTAAGSPVRATLYATDGSGVALAQPVLPVRGMISFAVESTVAAVDIYGHAPRGQWFVARNIKPASPSEIYVDTNKLEQVAIIPFAFENFPPTVETLTGFVEPTGAVFNPTPWVRVTTADAGITLNVGTQEFGSGGGDLDGFMAGVTMANVATVAAQIANAANTMGALFEGQDSANAGDLVPRLHVSTGRAITATLSTGADTARGFIHLPYHLSA
jgi:hypothetical protein